MSTLAQVIDRAQLIAMSGSGMSSPVFDNDFVAELLYPLVMKKVVLEAGLDPYKQKDVRISQNVTITSGVGTMPTNVALECVETARVAWNGAVKTFTTTDVNISSDLIAITAHGYSTGQPVIITGSAPGGLTVETVYYIVKIDADNISFAETLYKAAFYGIYTGHVGASQYIINLTSTGSGTMSIRPEGGAGKTSYVPSLLDLTRPMFQHFSYWTVDRGNMYFLPFGGATISTFTGSMALEAVVFPIINSNNIQIVAGTDLAEDIVDDIVRELASAIKQEVAVKSLAA